MKSKFLESKKDIMGGALVLKGTRMPIDVILTAIALGWDTKELRDAYPHYFERIKELSRE